MNRNKILFSCLLATLLVGPLGQVYGAKGGGHGGGGHHGGAGRAAAVSGGGGHWHGGGGAGRAAAVSGGHWHGGGGWNGGHGWHGHGWGWGFGLGWPGWGNWGDGWAYPYPVDNTIYVQGSTCSVTPDQVYSMTNDVATAMKANLSQAARSIGDQYRSEFSVYVQMLQNNDPGASDQACKLQGIYESFQNVSQGQSMPSVQPAGGYIGQPIGVPAGGYGY